jgi:hypothetical protein
MKKSECKSCLIANGMAKFGLTEKKVQVCSDWPVVKTLKIWTGAACGACLITLVNHVRLVQGSKLTVCTRRPICHQCASPSKTQPHPYIFTCHRQAGNLAQAHDPAQHDCRLQDYVPAKQDYTSITT